MTDITSEMGITRGLFYYYFAGKEELNNAIVESYVSELINNIEDACAQCDNREDSMFALVKCVYNALYFEDGSRRPVWHVLREIDKMDAARRLAANEITDFIITHGMLVKYGKPSVENLIVHAHFVASGILGECGLRPDIPIEAICDAACASLRYRKRRA